MPPSGTESHCWTHAAKSVDAVATCSKRRAGELSSGTIPALTQAAFASRRCQYGGPATTCNRAIPPFLEHWMLCPSGERPLDMCGERSA